MVFLWFDQAQFTVTLMVSMVPLFGLPQPLFLGSRCCFLFSCNNFPVTTRGPVPLSAVYVPQVGPTVVLRDRV